MSVGAQRGWCERRSLYHDKGQEEAHSVRELQADEGHAIHWNLRLEAKFCINKSKVK